MNNTEKERNKFIWWYGYLLDFDERNQILRTSQKITHKNYPKAEKNFVFQQVNILYKRMLIHRINEQLPISHQIKDFAGKVDFIDNR